MRSVVLTGMMGTGKTTVGRIVADRRGCAFVDLDRVVEEAAGRSVARIFADEGEPGFREREKAAVRAVVETADDGPLVLATGGWTIADPESRAALERVGDLVCLTADAAVLERRLAGHEADARPLALGDIAALARRRRPVYDSIPLQVDTTGRDASRVADHVDELARWSERVRLSTALPAVATSLPVVTPTGGYAVLIGPGILPALGSILAARDLGTRASLVTDPTVGRLYGRTALESLRCAGVRGKRISMPAGERAKCLATVSSIYGRFLDAGLDRSGLVVALGGGVVCDTAGFAASTFLRGVNVVHAPTSLVAMVDAAIGGKTAVNLPRGKNLVGTFHHPTLVLADPALLATLPAREIRCGMAEVVKTALVGDPGLLAELERAGAPAADHAESWSRVVVRAATVKARIVSDDPDERDGRIVLNLGHSFAHALETATAHALAHGEAVSIGLVAAADLAARVGYGTPDAAERLERLLVRLGLPTTFGRARADEVLDAMAVDKKRRHGALRFVLADGAGNVRVVDDVPSRLVLAVLAARRATGNEASA